MKEVLEKEVALCQKELETHFGQLGEVISTLMSKVTQKANTAEKIITQYRKRLKLQEADSITAVVHHLEDNVHSLSRNLEQVDKELEESITFLSDNLEKFHAVEENISQIKEYSELMELMALNSMVVAIKAGSKGGGYTYITEVLRKNASSTKDLTDELQELGDLLRNNLGDLHNHMSELNAQRHDLEEMEKNILDNFREFHRDMDQFIVFLDQMIRESSQVRSQVLVIAEKVSHQDIYRQSLDHISLLVDEIKDTNHDTEEENLDQLTYLKFLNEFSLPLLEEIKMKLDDNIQVFEGETLGVEDLLKTIEEKRKSFLLEYRESLFQRLTLIKNDLFKITQATKHFLKDIEALSMVNRSIVDRVMNLKERNGRFDRIIKAFRNVIIMGRIEVTKHEALRGVEVSVNDIAKITESIDEKVNSTEESIMGVLDMNHDIVFKLQELKGHLTGFVESFNQKIMDFENTQDQGSKLFRDTMEQLNYFPKVIQGKFHDALQASKALKEVIAALTNLESTLKENLGQVVIDRDRILSKKGLENWEIRNENINKVLEQFTIHHHKSAAKQLAGNGQDAGDSAAEESSVVLF